MLSNVPLPALPEVFLPAPLGLVLETAQPNAQLSAKVPSTRAYTHRIVGWVRPAPGIGSRPSHLPCYAQGVGHPGTRRATVICAQLLAFGAVAAQAHADPPPAFTEKPAAVPAGRILSGPPAQPEPHATYVFYLHGRIVEQQGENAVSPDFGRYEYRSILEALAASGGTVISELRPNGTAVGPYARKVAKQIRGLLAAGVPATSITVIGASKGGAIALRISQSLPTAGIGYVLLGSCNEGSPVSKLHGDVLSIYEHSDPIGRSCGPSFAKSPELGKHRELEIESGLRHGFLYRPIAQWLDPALRWIQAATR
jgi:hypothetical protein